MVSATPIAGSHVAIGSTPARPQGSRRTAGSLSSPAVPDDRQTAKLRPKQSYAGHTASILATETSASAQRRRAWTVARTGLAWHVSEEAVSIRIDLLASPRPLLPCTSAAAFRSQRLGPQLGLRDDRSALKMQIPQIAGIGDEPVLAFFQVFTAGEPSFSRNFLDLQKARYEFGGRACEFDRS